MLRILLEACRIEFVRDPRSYSFVYPPLPHGCQRRCRAERSATHRDSCPSWKIWRVCWEARTRFDVQRSLSVCVCAAELQGKNWIGKSDSGGGGAIWQVTQQRRIHTWDLSHVVIPAAYWTIHVYAFQVNLKFCILIQNISIFFLKNQWSMYIIYSRNSEIISWIFWLFCGSLKPMNTS